jgi:hypothetical protein
MATLATMPTSTDDLTPTWLAGALGRPVDVVSVDSIGVGVGIMGSLARLHVGFADGTTTSLVAKLSSRVPETVAVAQHYGFYTSEVKIYTEIGEDLGVRTPRCHHADVTEDGSACVLLLEDLGGSVAHDQIVGCPRALAATVVDEMAKLHATWWRSQRLASMPWMRPVNNDAYKGAQDHFLRIWPEFLAGPYSAGIEQRWLDVGLRYGRQIVAMVDDIVASRPLTICHYDTRLDNLFFDLPDGSPIAVLDWQLTVQSVGAGDIAYFLCQSMQTDDRRAIEDEMLRRYHERLQMHGVTDYSWDDLVRDYRLSVAGGLSISVVGSTMDPGNDRGRELLHVMVERSFAALADHDPSDLFL